MEIQQGASLIRFQRMLEAVKTFNQKPQLKNMQQLTTSLLGVQAATIATELLYIFALLYNKNIIYVQITIIYLRKYIPSLSTTVFC